MEHSRQNGEIGPCRRQDISCGQGCQRITDIIGEAKQTNAMGSMVTMMRLAAERAARHGCRRAGGEGVCDRSRSRCW